MLRFRKLGPFDLACSIRSLVLTNLQRLCTILKHMRRKRYWMAHIFTVVVSSFSTISFLRELAILINVIIVDSVWESSYYSLYY